MEKGLEEVFCRAINIQIKNEMYLRGLCLCVFVNSWVTGTRVLCQIA